MPDIPTLFARGAMLSLGHNLWAQGRYTEAEQLGLVALPRAQDFWDAHTVSDSIEALRVMAWSQYQQHKAKPAEETLKMAISMAIEHWGMSDPWAIEIMTDLEKWLRGWGRGEADDLRAEICNRK